MKHEEWIAESLQGLARRDLSRVARTPPSDGDLLNFASNDYLNFARHPALAEAAAKAGQAAGAGATASRLVCGTHALHEELESRLARFKGYPVALLFGSGYLANLGAIPALVGRDDTVFADRLAHASIVDAALLSRATLKRFQHNDPEHLDRLLAARGAGRALVVTESVFSMDGDLAPLRDLTDVAEKHGAMMLVDEAHATGVFGPHGAGLVAASGLGGRINVSLFTLSKALGGYGGAVACSSALREWLVNTARAFIYTTAPPPAVVASALAALDLLEAHADLGATVLRRAARFRELLHAEGLDTLNSESPIVPVVLGDNARALHVAERLKERGLLAIAIRPPTVPEGTARIRFTVTLAHTDDDIARAAREIAAACRAEKAV